jgi:DNA-binding NarL/FixJ family response regulator
MAVRIVLVDDHKIMRDGIRTILQHSDEFRIVGEADNGLDAVRLCKQLMPDIVILDIGLPKLDGLHAATEILRYCSQSRIIILSMHDDENSVMTAIRAGARAFVLKQASASDLLEALQTVARGGSYLSSQVSDQLLNRIRRGNLEGKSTAPGLEGLTPREIQVLRLVADGRTSKEIATALDLGLETVRSYRKTMMKKIGVNNVAALTQVALSSGLTKAQLALRAVHD